MAKRRPKNQRQPEWRKKMEDENPAQAKPETAAEAAPPPAPAPAPSLDEMIAMGVQKALERLQIPAAAAPAQSEKSAPTAAVAASTLRPDADPNFVEGEGQTRTQIQFSLLERHADWLVRVARQNGVTVSHLLEVLVRRAWAADPTKGGTILVALPDQKGQPAATAPREK